MKPGSQGEGCLEFFELQVKKVFSAQLFSAHLPTVSLSSLDLGIDRGQHHTLGPVG